MLKTRAIPFLALLGGTLAVAFAATTIQDAPLRLKLEPGQAYRYETVTANTLAMSGMADQTMETKSTIVSKFEVGETTDGWTKLTMSNEDVKLTLPDGGMMGGMGPDPAAVAESMKKMKTTLEVDGRGQVRNVAGTGMDDLDPMTRSTLQQPLEMMKQIGLNGILWPEGPLAVGTKWTGSLAMGKMMEEMSMGFLTNFKGEIPTTFEVKGFEDMDGKKVVRVEAIMDGKMTFDIAAPGMEGTGESTMNGKTTSWYDLGTGMLVKSDAVIATVTDMGMMQIENSTKVTTTLLKN